jgi:hypothetical protein
MDGEDFPSLIARKSLTGVSPSCKESVRSSPRCRSMSFTRGVSLLGSSRRATLASGVGGTEEAEGVGDNSVRDSPRGHVPNDVKNPHAFSGSRDRCD